MPPTMRYPASGLTSGCGGGEATGRHQRKSVARIVEAELGDGKHLQFAARHVSEDV
jgi:hypothetical protein